MCTDHNETQSIHTHTHTHINRHSHTHSNTRSHAHTHIQYIPCCVNYLAMKLYSDSDPPVLPAPPRGQSHRDRTQQGRGSVPRGSASCSIHCRGNSGERRPGSQPARARSRTGRRGGTLGAGGVHVRNDDITSYCSTLRSVKGILFVFLRHSLAVSYSMVHHSR